VIVTKASYDFCYGQAPVGPYDACYMLTDRCCPEVPCSEGTFPSPLHSNSNPHSLCTYPHIGFSVCFSGVLNSIICTSYMSTISTPSS